MQRILEEQVLNQKINFNYVKFYTQNSCLNKDTEKWKYQMVNSGDVLEGCQCRKWIKSMGRCVVNGKERRKDLRSEHLDWELEK